MTRKEVHAAESLPLSSKHRLAPVLALGMAAAVIVLPAQRALSDWPSRIVQPSPGGIDPRPVMLTTTNAEGQLQAMCAGFGGGPFQAAFSTDLTSGTWTKVGPVFNTNHFNLVLTNVANVCLYRVSGPNPNYGGASYCANCHDDPTTPGMYEYTPWSGTLHAGAFTTLTSIGQGSNASCLPCHTVGYGFPNGYTNGYTALQGVQCENCHGPGKQSHGTAVAKRPDVELNAMLCGGCHTTAHHPTYDEWLTSGHAKVTPDFANGFSSSQLGTCAACHSGAARFAMLDAYLKGADFQSQTNVTLPSGAEAAAISQVCVTCHDPHGATTNIHQLRNPIYSTKFFSYSTSTNFAAQYDPDVMMCAQCHNERGAVWTGTSRPPHHSPQYNMIIGDMGTNSLYASYGGFTNSAHTTAVTNLCITCHMAIRTEASPTEANPNYTGHSFDIQTNSCVQCHADGDARKTAIQAEITGRISTTVALLNTWATTKAPGLGMTNGIMNWEFTTPGALSSGTVGPTSADQAKIPNDIKQARFNLYIVAHDQSLGVHNANYARYLLNVATNKVGALLP